MGWQFSGSIISSYATTGNVNGGAGDNDLTGGLVGQQDWRSSIISSYATGAVNDGGEGDNDLVGGLVGGQGSGVRISKLWFRYGYG